MWKANCILLQQQKALTSAKMKKQQPNRKWCCNFLSFLNVSDSSGKTWWESKDFALCRPYSFTNTSHSKADWFTCKYFEDISISTLALLCILLLLTNLIVPIKFKKLCKLDQWGLKMFWLIRFGKTPCFKSIFFVSVHRAKGDSTLQHIPAELQIHKWAAGTIDLIEKIRIQEPHSFLSSQPLFHVRYTCQVMFVHAQSPMEGLFSTRFAEFALYHLLQMFKRICASQDSMESGCRDPGLPACQLAYILAEVLWNISFSMNWHFQRRKCFIRIFPFSSNAKIDHTSLICNKCLNKKCWSSRAVCLKGYTKGLYKHHQRWNDVLTSGL